MLGLGIISIILGLAGIIYGSYLNNDWEAQLESLFSYGSTNPGTLFIIIGGALIGVGVILIIADIAKKSRVSAGTTTASNPVAPVASSVQRDNSLRSQIVCPSCGKGFTSATMITFCPACGSRMDSKRDISVAKPKPVVSICSKCGAKLLSNGTCPNCDSYGDPINKSQTESPNNSTSNAPGLKPTRWSGE